MLTNTCKYAIRSVVYLSVYSSKEKKIGIKQIAEELDIPTPFLGKILQTLSKKKLLLSTKGPNGGFYLARPAEDIHMMEIVELIDGTDMFDTCLIRASKCSDEEPCSIHDHVTSIRSELKNFFYDQTILDLASEFRKDSKRVRI